MNGHGSSNLLGALTCLAGFVLGFFPDDATVQFVIWILTMALVLFRSFVCLWLAILVLFFGSYLSRPAIREQLGFAEIMVALALLVYLSVALRFLNNSREALWKQWIGNGQAPEESLTTGDHSSKALSWQGFVWPIAISVILMTIALSLTPTDRFYPNHFVLVPPVVRAIFYLVSISMIWLCMYGVFAWLRWRRLTADQAKIYLLHVANHELEREQNYLEKKIVNHSK